jgi:hypothetical protein
MAYVHGINGARLAKNWEWDVLAPQWEAVLQSQI